MRMYMWPRPGIKRKRRKILDPGKELDNIAKKLRESRVKCECGAEKAKTTHSTWCPKYKKEKDE